MAAMFHARFVPTPVNNDTLTGVWATKKRIQAIDVVRGAIMIIMALDHAREFFHISKTDPTDLYNTTAMLFLTRWITHFCAPAFILLSGISIYLAGQRRTKVQLSIFLLSRGLWLIMVDAILITFALTLDPAFHNILLQVLWVTGWSMVFMAGIIWLPYWVIIGVGTAIFFGHDLFDNVTFSGSMFGHILQVLFGESLTWRINAHHAVIFNYAIMPWFSVMILGYLFGRLYQSQFNAKKRQQILLLSGSVFILLFIVLRVINIYGDALPWQQYNRPGFTFLSFINTSKYPPSLDFLFMTLGPILITLALAERSGNSFIKKIMTVYGNVPFFYYIIQFYIIRIFSVLAFFMAGYTSKDIPVPGKNAPHPIGFRIHLWQVYLVWILVVALLYYPCKYYGRYKQTHKQWWLSYL